MNDPINRSFEKLVGEDRVGIGRMELSTKPEGDRFRYGHVDCMRSGCHRAGTKRTTHLLCEPCYEAVIAGESSPSSAQHEERPTSTTS